jgi:hypothetical protein
MTGGRNVSNEHERRWVKFVEAASQSRRYDSGFKFTRRNTPSAVVYKMTATNVTTGRRCVWYCHVVSEEDASSMPDNVRSAIWFLADLCAQVGGLHRAGRLSFAHQRGKRSFMLDCRDYVIARGTVRRWVRSRMHEKELMFQFPLPGMVSVGCVDD